MPGRPRFRLDPADETATSRHRQRWHTFALSAPRSGPDTGQPPANALQTTHSRRSAPYVRCTTSRRGICWCRTRRKTGLLLGTEKGRLTWSITSQVPLGTYYPYLPQLAAFRCLPSLQLLLDHPVGVVRFREPLSERDLRRTAHVADKPSHRPLLILGPSRRTTALRRPERPLDRRRKACQRSSVSASPLLPGVGRVAERRQRCPAAA